MLPPMAGFPTFLCMNIIPLHQINLFKNDSRIKKMWYIYTMENYSAIKKNEIMPFAATWMDPEIVILSDVSQKQKDEYHMI